MFSFLSGAILGASGSARVGDFSETTRPARLASHTGAGGGPLFHRRHREKASSDLELASVLLYSDLGLNLSRPVMHKRGPLHPSSAGPSSALPLPLRQPPAYLSSTHSVAVISGGALLSGSAASSAWITLCPRRLKKMMIREASRFVDQSSAAFKRPLTCYSDTGVLDKGANVLNFNIRCELARSEGAKASNLDECPYNENNDPVLRAMWQDGFVTSKLYGPL